MQEAKVVLIVILVIGLSSLLWLGLFNSKHRTINP